MGPWAMFHGDIHGTGASAEQSPQPRCDSRGPLSSHLSSTRAFADSGAVYLNSNDQFRESVTP